MLRVQKTANALAMLDVFASFAYVAERNDYCKPEITDNGIIDIKKGRHPVVETMISNGMFIENDTYFYRDEVYGYNDDVTRFAVFNVAVLEMMIKLDYYPDICHEHYHIFHFCKVLICNLTLYFLDKKCNPAFFFRLLYKKY